MQENLQIFDFALDDTDMKALDSLTTPENLEVSAYIHTYIHTYIQVVDGYWGEFIHTCIHTYMYTLIHIYIHEDSLSGEFWGECVYVHACIHMYIHTYIQEYIHACIHRRMQYIQAELIHTWAFTHNYIHTQALTYIHSAGPLFNATTYQDRTYIQNSILTNAHFHATNILTHIQIIQTQKTHTCMHTYTQEYHALYFKCIVRDTPLQNDPPAPHQITVD